MKTMNNRKIPVATDFIKLDSFLKYANVASDGAEAKRAILNGEISVNGEICLTRGKKLYPGDTVSAGGELLEVASDADKQA